jgi:hypothetical protein
MSTCLLLLGNRTIIVGISRFDALRVSVFLSSNVPETYVTVKLVLLVEVPHEVVTVIGPMVAPVGTVVVICESEFTVNVAVTPTRTPHYPEYPERWMREDRKPRKSGTSFELRMQNQKVPNLCYSWVANLCYLLRIV